MQFLSEDWFAMVETCNNNAGDLPLSPKLESLVLNIGIVDDSPIKLHLKKGKIHPNFADNPLATFKTDKKTLLKLINKRDLSGALSAFMMGKIRVDGDMSALLALKSIKPADEVKALYKVILAETQVE